MLPHVDDFMLHLEVEHYSAYTVRDYKRYLEFFDHFPNYNNIPFNRINKKTITSYKS